MALKLDLEDRAKISHVFSFIFDPGVVIFNIEFIYFMIL